MIMMVLSSSMVAIEWMDESSSFHQPVETIQYKYKQRGDSTYRIDRYGTLIPCCWAVGVTVRFDMGSSWIRVLGIIQTYAFSSLYRYMITYYMK
jgi:hypothetical protein